MAMTREERIARMKDRQSNSGNTSNYISAYVIPKEVQKFTPKEGENRIDIIPYRITNPINPAILRDGFELGEIDYFQHCFTHRRIGINNNEYLCTNKMFNMPCPICNAQKDYFDAKNKDAAVKLYPFERAVYNVIDLDEPEKGIQVWEVSYNWVEKELANLSAMKSKRGQTIVYGDWEIGKTIVFYGTKKEFGGNDFVQPGNFSFEERETQYEESICDKAWPLDQYYVMPEYEKVLADFMQSGTVVPPTVDAVPQNTITPTIEPPQYTEKPLDRVAGAKGPTFEELAEADRKLLEGDEIVNEKPAQDATGNTTRRRRETTPAETGCPLQHVFGKDFDNFQDCTKCPDATYELCGAEFDKQN